VALVLVCGALAGCGMQGSKPDSKPDAGGGGTVCRPITEPEVASLFDRWNDSLKTLDAHKVVANYAPRSILLPTVSNKPRVTEEEKLEYFEKFLKNKPSGKIDFRFFIPGCNSAVDAGLYTFTYGTDGTVVHARYTYTYAWDGRQWLITSHHSSKMPEPVKP
jgi:uncharacterized protein (TIGR02246 family)